MGQRLYYSYYALRGSPGGTDPLGPSRGHRRRFSTVAATPPTGSFEEYLADAGMNFEFRRGRLESTRSAGLGLSPILRPAREPDGPAPDHRP